MKRKAVLLFLLTTFLLTSTGCWNRRELEEEAHVLAIGVDQGTRSLFSITFVIAVPRRMASGGKGGGGGGGSKDEKPYFITTLEAPSLTGAIGMANSYLSRLVSLRHARALFMGEEMARISGMHTVDEIVRFRESRRSIYFIVTKGTAQNFLHGMDPLMEEDPQRFIEQMTNNVRQTGTVPATSQVQSFISAVSTHYAEPMTYYAALKESGQGVAATGSMSETDFTAGNMPRTGGPNIEMLGAAAFRGERMVGTLTGQEVRTVLMLQNRFQRGFFTVQDPHRSDLHLSLELRQGRPFRANVDLSGPRPRVTGTVTLEAELLGIQSEIDYTDPERQHDLEAATEQALAGQIHKLIAKTQSWNTDVVGFGREVVRRFPTVEEWVRYNWPTRYKDADVQIGVRVTVRRFGKQLSPPHERGAGRW